jgi:hypothetical protein
MHGKLATKLSDRGRRQADHSAGGPHHQYGRRNPQRNRCKGKSSGKRGLRRLALRIRSMEFTVLQVDEKPMQQQQAESK